MIFIISMNLDNTNLLADMHLTGFEPIIAKNVQKINFKFTMISIFTTLFNKNNTISSENTSIGSNIVINNGYNSVVTVFTTIDRNNSTYSANSTKCTDKCNSTQHPALRAVHYVQHPALRAVGAHPTYK